MEITHDYLSSLLDAISVWSAKKDRLLSIVRENYDTVSLASSCKPVLWRLEIVGLHPHLFSLEARSLTSFAVCVMDVL